MDNTRVAQELVRIAKELIGASWREFDDKKGHRWAMYLGDYDAYITEIQGPGIPLYRVQVMFPSGDQFKYKRQMKNLKDAQKIAEKTLKALDSDNSAGVDLSREWMAL